MGNKVRLNKDGVLLFHCPGCDGLHMVYTKNSNHLGAQWQFNGDLEKPTFSPSVLVKYPANPQATEEFKEWRKERICHSFIKDGQIQFLDDCTHELAGQTVDLPDYKD